VISRIQIRIRVQIRSILKDQIRILSEMDRIRNTGKKEKVEGRAKKGSRSV
jgi:hypothetical protein